MIKGENGITGIDKDTGNKFYKYDVAPNGSYMPQIIEFSGTTY